MELWPVQLLVLGCVLVLVSCSQDYYELLGVPRDADAKTIRKAFKKLAIEKHPDKHQGDQKAHDEFLEITKVYEVLKDQEKRRKYDMFGEEGLKEDGGFGRGQYQSWRFYQEDFGIYDEDPEIVTLSRSDFETLVANSEEPWFINFYSPQCSHCHTLAPTWREVGRELEGVVRIGAVNCGDDWQLCSSQGVRGYPSLILYPQREKYAGPRDTEHLVQHAMRHAQVPVTELTTHNFRSETSGEGRADRPWLLTLCGDGADCLEMHTLQKLAVMLEGVAVVGHVTCYGGEALCEQLGAEAGTFYFPPGTWEREKATSIPALHYREVATSVLQLVPDLQGVTGEELEKIQEKLKAGSEEAWLIHFVSGEKSEGLGDMELRKLPALLQHLKVGRVDCQAARTQCNDLFITKLPAFVLLKSGGGLEIYHGRQVAPDVATFARDAAANPVTVLSSRDFPDPVTSGGSPWFVDFFAPWCPPCMRLLPEFRKAAKAMEGSNVRFGTVDCTVHHQLCQNYNVRSYPTTILYNMTQPHEFHGHHSSEHIVEFVHDILEPPVLILTEETFAAAMESKPDDAIFLVDFFAPWCGPCRQLAPEWRRLAKSFKDNPQVLVGSVDCQAQQALCQAQGVSGYPSIHLYPSGPYSGRSHEYSSWHRNAQSIRAWAQEHLPSDVAVLDYDKFQEHVGNGAYLLVDYYAPWCGHCQVFAPRYEQIAQKLQGRAVVGKVNCDAQQWLCQQQGISAYPSIRLYTPGSHKLGESISSQDPFQIINTVLARMGVTGIPRDEL